MSVWIPGRSVCRLDDTRRVEDFLDSCTPIYVSGSAFKLSNGRAYHHGTMLINSDLEALGRYLRVHKVRSAAF